MSIERLTLIVFENIKQSQLTGGPRTLAPTFLIAMDRSGGGSASDQESRGKIASSAFKRKNCLLFTRRKYYRKRKSGAGIKR